GPPDSSPPPKRSPALTRFAPLALFLGTVMAMVAIVQASLPSWPRFYGSDSPGAQEHNGKKNRRSPE
ncbi:MAG TPA: hypothetical protein VHG10_15580, partial [Glycomyces sp.]|nr:hypothetical protein [Glycomyces sp.]